MQRSVVMFVVMLAAMLCGCTDGTRIRVEIAADASLAIDSYQLKVEDRVALAEPRSVLELLVDDAMADTTAMVEVWGLAGGNQIAYGTSTVIPEKNGTVTVQIALVPIACGTWCQPGERACASSGGGDGTIECVQGTDGCLQWSVITACSSATPYCSNGVCAATCADECSAGEKACDGAASVRACGQYDSDECLDWSPPTACGANQTCAAGVCVTMQACSNGAACDDGNACTEYDECGSGVCAGEQIECLAAFPECVAGKLRMYGSVGTCAPTSGECNYSYTDATCAVGCNNDACHQRLAVGHNSSCALGSTGGVTCWGDMTGDGPTTLMNSISLGRYHGCGMTVTGNVTCWSSETFGNTFGECDVPSGTFSSVSAGGEFTCAVRTNGSLACWGDNTKGQLNVPTGTFTSVSAGYYHACAIRTNGSVACWGENTSGESSPPGGVFTKLASGYPFTCGIRIDGALACWGVYANMTPAGTYIDVAAGFSHACAIRSDGAARCWGLDTSGKATPPNGSFTSIGAGMAHSCATRADGKIVCWGDPTGGTTTVPAGF